MKNYLLLLLLTMTSVFVNAQNKDSYFKDPKTDTYVGTWQGEFEGKTFTVTFVKYRKKLATGQRDQLAGKYTYKQGDKLLSGSDNLRDTLLRGLPDPKENFLTILMIDRVLDKNGRGKISFVDSSKNKILWTLSDRDLFALYPKKPVKGFSIPTNIVLVRTK